MRVPKQLECGLFPRGWTIAPTLDWTNSLSSQMLTILEEYLDDYNQTNISQMKLVLFSDAIQHICRICRIIRQPLGNALLLGVGGSGRQSLTR